VNHPVLIIRNLTLSYPRGFWGKQAPVLTDFSFSAQSGEFVGIVGANGCGKTTLLKAIAGLISPAAGSINLTGLTCAYVPDQYQGSGFLTIQEFLTLGCRLKGMPCAEQGPLVAHFIARMNLEPYKDQRISTLSKGTKQRLMIAYALLFEPMLLLLDEPFSGLDEPSTEIIELVLGQYSEQALILCTGHNPNNDLFSRVLNLEQPSNSI